MVKYFSLDETNVLRIVVTHSNGYDIITTKEHLRLPSNPDVGWIPSLVPEYKQSAKMAVAILIWMTTTTMIRILTNMTIIQRAGTWNTVDRITITRPDHPSFMKKIMRHNNP